MAFFHFIILLLFGVARSLNLLSPRADSILGVQKVVFPVVKDGNTFEYRYYGAVVTFSEESQKIFSQDAQIAGLALQALEEAKVEQAGIDDGSLGGMAVLLVGNEAYFASPISKARKMNQLAADFPPSFFYDVLGGNTKLQQQLFECYLDLDFSNPNHKIKKEHNKSANCGEIVAMQMWHMNHPGQPWPGREDNVVARVTYWYREERRTVNPCNGGILSSRWGCLQFAKANGILGAQPGFTADTVRGITQEERDKIQRRETVNSLWCREGDNPQRQDEPADAGPAGAPEAYTQEELEAFFEMDD